MRLWLVICQINHYIWCINLSRRKLQSALCVSLNICHLSTGSTYSLVCLVHELEWMYEYEASVLANESCTNKRLLACNFELLVTFCDDNKRNMKWSTSKTWRRISPQLSSFLSLSLALCTSSSACPTPVPAVQIWRQKSIWKRFKTSLVSWPDTNVGVASQKRKCQYDTRSKPAQQLASRACEWASVLGMHWKKLRNNY